MKQFRKRDKSQQKQAPQKPALDVQPNEPLMELPQVTDIMQMQRQYGNAAVQRMLQAGQLQQLGNSQMMVQRETPDTLSSTNNFPYPTPEPPISIPNPPGGIYPITPPNHLLDQFLMQPQYEENDYRFYLRYRPTNGQPHYQRPIMGEAVANLRIHVDFQNFDAIKDDDIYKDWEWSEADKKEFEWQDAEKNVFNMNLQHVIEDTWSEQHTLRGATPGFEQVATQLKVKVRLVNDASKAHVKMVSYKTPTRAPRYRSNASPDEAEFDWRDPTVDETNMHQTLDYFRVGPFTLGNEDMNADPNANELVTQADEAAQAIDKYGENGKEVKFKVTGRASSPGADKHNEELALNRAHSVTNYLVNKITATNFIPDFDSEGETGATDDPEFQRADIEIYKTGTQNIAAHESGHMFGLDDEYEDPEADENGRGVFNGDKPDHYDDVKNELGEDAADEVITDSSDSIMAHGDVVEPGHYTPFIQALEKATGIQWTIQ